MDECEIPDERPQDSLHEIHHSNANYSKLVNEQ